MMVFFVGQARAQKLSKINQRADSCALCPNYDILEIIGIFSGCKVYDAWLRQTEPSGKPTVSSSTGLAIVVEFAAEAHTCTPVGGGIFGRLKLDEQGATSAGSISPRELYAGYRLDDG